MDLQIGKTPVFLRPYSLLCHLNARCTWILHFIERILCSVNNANELSVWLLNPLLLSTIQTMLLRSATHLLHLLWINDFCSTSYDVSYISDLFSSPPCHEHSGILFQWGLTPPPPTGSHSVHSFRLTGILYKRRLHT
jgi:hypothetical protein